MADHQHRFLSRWLFTAAMLSLVLLRALPASPASISTVAGGLSGSMPALETSLGAVYSVAQGPDGSIYFRGDRRVRKIDGDGMVSTVAGVGAYGRDWRLDEGGSALEAYIGYGLGIAVGSDGSIYVPSFHKVLRIYPDGTIFTFAGTGEQGFAGDGGPAGEAMLDMPGDVALDSAGNVYIADTMNHRIRRVNTDGTIETVAGTVKGGSGDGGQAVEACLNRPRGVALDDEGNLYISDWFNAVIRKVDTTGIISTIAGTYEMGYSGDGGPATMARIKTGGGLVVRDDGTVFFSDEYNHRVRMITPDGMIDTVAGGGTLITGEPVLATAAFLGPPRDVALDREGNLLIPDHAFRFRIYQVDAGGIRTTIAGNGERAFCGDNGPALEADMSTSGEVVVDGEGRIFIADLSNHRIRMMDGEGIISTIAGGGQGPGLSSPAYLAIDTVGRVYLSDSINNRVLRFQHDGTYTVIGGFTNPRSVAVSPDGDIFVAEPDRVIKVPPSGGRTVIAADLQVTDRDVAVDSAGNVYITGYDDHQIFKVDRAGVFSVFAGNGGRGFSGDGGPAVQAMLDGPRSVAAGPGGNIFVADYFNSRIRMIDSEGIISTVAGNGRWDFDGDGGPPTDVSLNRPWGVAFGPDGRLYFRDSGNRRVRAIDFSSVNLSPDALHTGPYRIAVGSGLTLDGSASSDPDAAAGDFITSYTWDLDGDGSADRTGPVVTLSWAEVKAGICNGICPLDRPLLISLTVTDSNDTSDRAETTVTIDSTLPSPLLLQNASFEEGDRIPFPWTGKGLGSGDGCVTASKKEGNRSIKLRGRSRRSKALNQMISLSGGAGDTFTLSGWSRARHPHPRRGRYLLGMRISHLSGAAQTCRVPFPKRTHPWRYREKTCVASGDYQSVEVFLDYSRQRGVAWFDDVRLTVE